MDRRIKKSRNALERTLYELLQSTSISHITISELCRKADINRSTFYANFEDMNELLLAVHTNMFQKMLSCLQIEKKDGKHYTQKALVSLLSYMRNHQKQIRTIIINSEDDCFARNYCRYLMNYHNIQESQQDYYIYLYHFSGSFTLIQHWLKNGCPYHERELAILILQLTQMEPPVS